MDLEKLIPYHPDRLRIYTKFLDLLKDNIENLKQVESITCFNYTQNDLQKMSINIERGIFNYAINCYNNYNSCIETWNDQFKNIYIGRAVIIYNNLNPHSNIKNSKLLLRLLCKEFNEFELCFFTPKQIFPEKWEELMQIWKSKEPKYADKPLDIDDGIFKCGKCRSLKTTYYQLQTRSCDESLTTFVKCHNCNNKWKFSY